MLSAKLLRLVNSILVKAPVVESYAYMGFLPFQHTLAVNLVAVLALTILAIGLCKNKMGVCAYDVHRCDFWSGSRPCSLVLGDS